MLAEISFYSPVTSGPPKLAQIGTISTFALALFAAAGVFVEFYKRSGYSSTIFLTRDSPRSFHSWNMLANKNANDINPACNAHAPYHMSYRYIELISSRQTDTNWTAREWSGKWSFDWARPFARRRRRCLIYFSTGSTFIVEGVVHASNAIWKFRIGAKQAMIAF